MTPALRLSLFYVGFFLSTGVQLPFWPVWLAARGLDAGEIGALLAISQWVRVAANPLLGSLADRAADRRRFMVLLGALCVAGYLLCLPAHGFAALILPSALGAAAAAALLPLADVMALAAAAEGRLDYGRVRLWGTIAFIVATLAVGRILAGRSSDIVLYLLLATTTLTTLACMLLPRVAAHPLAPSAMSWRSLATSRNLIFLTAATLIQASHAVYYGFGTLYWQRIGISDAVIAGLWAEGAVAEVVLFYCGARLLRRLGPLALLALGGAGGLLRWSATAFVTSVPPLVALQPLHALSFAAAHLGAMHYLAREIAPSQAGTAQSLYTATVSGIGFGLAALMAGALYGRVGGAAYLAMAAMAGVGGVMALGLNRLGRNYLS